MPPSGGLTGFKLPEVGANGVALDLFDVLLNLRGILEEAAVCAQGAVCDLRSAVGVIGAGRVAASETRSAVRGFRVKGF